MGVSELAGQMMLSDFIHEADEGESGERAEGLEGYDAEGNLINTSGTEAER